MYNYKIFFHSKAVAWAKPSWSQAMSGGFGLAYGFTKLEPARAKPKPWLSGQAKLCTALDLAEITPKPLCELSWMSLVTDMKNQLTGNIPQLHAHCFLCLILHTDHNPQNTHPLWQAFVRLQDCTCQGWPVIVSKVVLPIFILVINFSLGNLKNILPVKERRSWLWLQPLSSSPHPI